MHVGFLTTEYAISPIEGGGIGTFLKNIAHILNSNGISITILYWGNKLKQRIYDEDILIIPIKQVYKGKLSFFFNRIYMNREVNKIIKERHIDILETIDWEGLTAFCKFTVPLVMRLHGSNCYFDALLQKNTPKLMKFLEYDSVKRASAYIGVSRQALVLTSELFKIDAKKKSEVIYNPINEDLISKYSIGVVKENPSTIIYYGTIARKKGVLNIPLIFNEVHKIYPDINLFIVGRDTYDVDGGSLWKKVEMKFSESAGKRVKYFGCLPYEELLKLLSTADICLLPSYAETFGLVLLEAMFLKKPIVSSNILCFQEIATNKKEVLQCNPNDINSYVEAICLLIQNKKLRVAIAENANRKAMTKFSNKIIAEQNINFYNRVLCEL